MSYAFTIKRFMMYEHIKTPKTPQNKYAPARKNPPPPFTVKYETTNGYRNVSGKNDGRKNACKKKRNAARRKKTAFRCRKHPKESSLH